MVAPSKASDWPIKINITELPVWKENWDPAGDIGMHASDAAWEDIKALDVQDLSSYIYEMLKASKVRWLVNKVGNEDLERLAQQLKDDHSLLEFTHYALMDTMTWAYEEAVTPNDSDIRSAMESAAKYLRENAFFDGEGVNTLTVPSKQARAKLPEDWDPREKGGFTEAQFWKELDDYVRYDRDPGYYDRFLIFNWQNGPVVSYIKDELRKNPDPDELRHFQDYLLKEMAETYRDGFEKALKNEFEGVDVSNRTNFQKHWKSMLADKKAMKHVAAEIKDYLSKYPVDESR